MALLPDLIDPTLAALDLALEEESRSEKPRPYLGRSEIGGECERRIWYRFRWVGFEQFDAATLKRFADGHRSEALMIERLRKVAGIELHTLTEEGGQIGFSDHDGHFRGHVDGMILGLIQAPKAWHVWECKAVDDKKLNKLIELKRGLGEKVALAAWDRTYYAQAQLYMHYAGVGRHYLTAVSPGGRRHDSVRTNYDQVEALRLVERARRIIGADAPPSRVSDSEAFYICRYCPFSGICHSGQLAERNCRTCTASTIVGNGEWICEKYPTHKTLSSDEQRAGCDKHLYNPGLVDGELIDAAADSSFAKYRMRNGDTWTDGEMPS